MKNTVSTESCIMNWLQIMRLRQSHFLMPKTGVFPVCIAESHWCLVVVSFYPVAGYVLYDPFANEDVLLSLQHIWSSHIERSIKSLAPFTTLRFKRMFPYVPTQRDGHNCGVFAGMVCEYMCRNLVIGGGGHTDSNTEWSKHMLHFFRLRMVSRLLEMFGEFEENRV